MEKKSFKQGYLNRLMWNGNRVVTLAFPFLIYVVLKTPNWPNDLKNIGRAQM